MFRVIYKLKKARLQGSLSSQRRRSCLSSFSEGVNCLNHPIFYGANCSSHRVISSFTGVNCLSHPVLYGANCSSHRVVPSFMGFKCLSHPVLMVLTVRAIVLLLPSGVLNVWDTAILSISFQAFNEGHPTRI